LSVKVTLPVIVAAVPGYGGGIGAFPLKGVSCAVKVTGSFTVEVLPVEDEVSETLVIAVVTVRVKVACAIT